MNTDLAMLSRTSATVEAIPPPRRRWKTRVLLPITLLVAFGGMLAWSVRGVLLPARTVRVVPVVVKSAAQTGGTAVFQAPGWLEADPYAIHVSALTDGVVKEVLVLEGQTVRANQEIVRLVDDDARLSLERAEAELKSAQASHEAGVREWENPVERKRAVAVAGARLAEVEGELKKLESEIAVESARVDEWSEQLRREEKAGAALAEYQAVRTRLQLVTQQALLTAARAKAPVLEAKRRQAEAEVSAAQENHRLRIPERRTVDETAGALARAESARSEAALRLARMIVRAPVDGVVLRRFVEPGTKLMLGGDSPASARAVSLYDPARLQVRVDVPLADAARVGVGQKARVTVEVLPDQALEGEVSRITHEADLQKNTLQMKVRLDRTLPELKPEMLARVQFLATAPKAAGPSETMRVFAPERLVRREGGRLQTWVADAGRGVAVLRDVTAGPGRVDGWMEVAQGLVPGDRLIADAPADLKDGERITISGEAEN